MRYRKKKDILGKEVTELVNEENIQAAIP